MKKQEGSRRQRFERIIAIALVVMLMPLVPLCPARAEDMTISIGEPIETQPLNFSWSSVANAVRYEYSVRDMTLDNAFLEHIETTNTSASIPGEYIIKDHTYKVWVGAFYATEEYNTPDVEGYSSAALCVKKKKQTLFGTNYELYNDTYHERHVVYKVECEICGEHLEYATETEKEKHSLKNGQCTLCGYTEEVEPLEVVVSRNQATAQVGDSIGATAEISGGSGKYLCGWEVTCDGKTIASLSIDESEINYTANKAGSWRFKITVLDTETQETVSDTSNSISVSEATCTHENKTETLIDTEYLQKNDSKHIVRNYFRVTCSNSSCGAILNPSYYKDTDEPHSLNNNGICSLCGYVLVTEECKHDEVNSELVGTELRQCDSDNNHYYVEFYKDVCANCKITVQEKREVKTLKPHELTNGKCACGYVQASSECDHATTRSVLETKVEQYSEAVHKMTVTYHVYCKCGQIDTKEDVESFPEHQFNENDLCTCGYQKIKNETVVTCTVDKTEVYVGESVTFIISGNVGEVDFVVDDTAYDTVTLSNGKGTFTRSFSEQGQRQVKFVASDGTSSNTITIRVNSKGQLAKTTVSVPASVEQGQSVTVSWTAVEHADSYVVRLYDEVPSELWKQETSQTSVTIPASYLNANQTYAVTVIATGENYAQSEADAHFKVIAPQLVIDAFIGSPSLEIVSNNPNEKPQIQVTATTDARVDRLSAVNNYGTSLREEWSKHQNSNGTITWTRVYTADISSTSRSWTLTAWVNGQAVGTATTNAVVIKIECTQHQFGDNFIENGKTFKKCSVCGYKERVIQTPRVSFSVDLYDAQKINAAWTDCGADYYTVSVYNESLGTYLLSGKNVGTALTITFNVHKQQKYRIEVSAFYRDQSTVRTGTTSFESSDIDLSNVSQQTTKEEALKELEYLSNSSVMDKETMEEVLDRAIQYRNDGILTEEEYKKISSSLISRWYFDDVLSADGESIKYQVGPDGSQVAQKELNQKVTVSVTQGLGLVLDNPVKTIDPFVEEFTQTMKTLASSLQSDRTYEKAFDIQTMLLELLTDEETKEIVKELRENSKNSLESAKELQKAFKALDKQMDWKTEINDCLSEVTIKGETILKIPNVNIDLESIGQKAKDIIEGFEEAERLQDFVNFVQSRANLDKERTLAYCETMDDADLSWELAIAKWALQCEVSDNQKQKFTAILTEYTITEMYKEVTKKINKSIEEKVSTNPVGAAITFTKHTVNALSGTDNIISNTRGMNAMYHNYEKLYENYLKLKKASENDPSNEEKREKAMNALELCLIFNISSSDYYKKSIEAVTKSVTGITLDQLANLAGHESFKDIDELLDMIKNDKAYKTELLETIKNSH